jgi:hypothetical protein
MRLLTVILLLAGLFGAYRWWDGNSNSNSNLDGIANQNGFVPVQMPDGAPEHSVLILAPPNCPSDEAQRAEALVQHLTEQGIPVTRGSSISFDIMNPTAEQRAGVERAVAVFNVGAPAVFINGMAMSNPTAAQAAVEYHRTEHRL